MGVRARVSRCSLQRRPRRDGEEAHLGVDGLPTSLVRPNWLYELAAPYIDMGTMRYDPHYQCRPPAHVGQGASTHIATHAARMHAHTRARGWARLVAALMRLVACSLRAAALRARHALALASRRQWWFARSPRLLPAFATVPLDRSTPHAYACDGTLTRRAECERRTALARGAVHAARASRCAPPRVPGRGCHEHGRGGGGEHGVRRADSHSERASPEYGDRHDAWSVRSVLGCVPAYTGGRGTWH